MIRIAKCTRCAELYRAHVDESDSGVCDVCLEMDRLARAEADARLLRKRDRLVGASAGLLLAGGVLTLLFSRQLSGSTISNASAGLTVTTTPPGVTVQLDEATLGVTGPDGRLVLNVPASELDAPLLLTHDGFEPRTIEPRDINGSELSVTLERAAVSVKIESSPSNAAVWINGEPRGETPLELSATPEELMAIPIRVVRDGYIPLDRTIGTADIKDELVWNAELVPTEPQLWITSDPSDAEVLIDGEAIGRTPFQYSLAADRRGQEITLEAAAEGYSNVTSTIIVSEEPGQPQQVNLDFNLSATELLVVTSPPGARLRVNQRDVGLAPHRVVLSSADFAGAVTIEAFDGSSRYGRKVVPAPAAGSTLSVTVDLNVMLHRVAFAIDLTRGGDDDLIRMRERLKDEISELRDGQLFTIIAERGDSTPARFAIDYVPATAEQKVRAYDFLDGLALGVERGDNAMLHSLLATSRPDMAFLLVSSVPSESQWNAIFPLDGGPVIRIVRPESSETPKWLLDWLSAHQGAAEPLLLSAGSNDWGD